MWDERYATAEYVYGTAPNVFLTGAAAHIRPGGRVLAVADGEGATASGSPGRASTSFPWTLRRWPWPRPGASPPSAA